MSSLAPRVLLSSRSQEKAENAVVKLQREQRARNKSRLRAKTRALLRFIPDCLIQKC